ncbi:MAG TPA: ABC transporter permease [Thermoanaerobaculia bacterium]|jgi:putative ABC transport system permease protein
MLTNAIKLALKVLGRRKFFTFISLFGISLTLVVLMVAAAILDNTFGPRKPESKFDRVLAVQRLGLYGPESSINGDPGYKFLKLYMRPLQGVEATSIASDSSLLTMYHGERKIETHLRRTDAAYWRIVDFDFIEGGPYTAEDDRRGNAVAVITEDMRDKLFGEGKSALGRTFVADSTTFRVIGVVPTVSIMRNAAFSEIWAPLRTMRSSEYENQISGSFIGLVLAKSPADFPRLKADFQRGLQHFVFEDPRTFNRVVAGLDTRFEAFARTALHTRGSQLGEVRTGTLRLIILAAAVLFVTLPTMNLVSINLSRIMERASEIGVRKAFGASSRALIGQFVLENVVLTLIGGAIGFVLSLIALQAISRTALVPYAVFDVNLRIFGYCMLIAAIFGGISGAYPAWRMSRMKPVTALRGGAL